MSVYENIEDKGEISAPWGKRIEIQELTYETGVKQLRLRIREGRRITDLELDPETAIKLAAVVGNWADKA
ncbi:MAG: hypothetical protein COB46_14090 [Rhodospirillaceae bacterium]|nr:MAG: hypothetical protein COB46_14090 [Rhodospirillaceae bacterium]